MPQKIMRPRIKPEVKTQIYKKSIQLIEDMAAKEVPIRKMDFVKDHEVDGRFFTTMEELKIIEPVVGTHKEGTIYRWLHKKASNEPDTFLADRVIGTIAKHKAEYNKFYNSPAEVKKRTVKAYEAEQRQKRLEQELAKKASKEKPAEVPVIEQPAQSTDSLPKIEEYSKISFSFSGTLTKEQLLKKIEAIISEGNITSFTVEVTY